MHRPKIIIIGGGISGLCAAYELDREEYDVTVLEAAGRSGGHVMTVRDRLADGLYADAGAEHFFRPGYDQLWSYIEKFQLPVIPYPRREKRMETINGRAYSPEQLRDPSVLEGLGFNQREIEFLGYNQWGTLATGLYFAPFADRFKDEYNPFDAGLNHLDQIGANEFLLQLGASKAATGQFGLDPSTGPGQSALEAVWHAVIRAKRGMALCETKLFRVPGGNQQIVDAFAVALSERVKLACPVTLIEHTSGGVRVHYQDRGASQIMEGDRLVSSVPLSQLRKIQVTPAWPEAKRYIVENMPYDTHSRVIFQSRTRFWERDGLSPNMNLGEVSLNAVWAASQEVKTKRGILLGTIATGTPEEECTPEKVLAAFRRRYPGKSEDIEQCQVITWPQNPWGTSCLPMVLPPGELSKYWPEVIRPVGRIHFAGVYADNLPFGLEAGIRSARRVVREINESRGMAVISSQK